MTDPTKLAGAAKDGQKPADIDQAVQASIMDQGQIGDIYYGLSMARRTTTPAPARFEADQQRREPSPAQWRDHGRKQSLVSRKTFTAMCRW
jgi:hypothetical protein